VDEIWCFEDSIYWTITHISIFGIMHSDMLSIEIDSEWFIGRICEIVNQGVGGTKNVVETSSTAITEDWEDWVKNGYCGVWL